MVRLIIVALLVTAATDFAAAQRVPPADLTDISVSDFTDDELDLPYYLAHFHRIANAVVMEGPNRGFIDIAVWRPKDEAVPDNPRIMENILALAFFYATDRSWNPYYGHAAVRERLEAALQFWVRMQEDDGWFGERDAGGYTLANTTFAVKFMGETLRLLESGPPIDSSIMRSAIDTQRRAILAILDPVREYDHAKRYTNHYTNLWGGALAYLDLYDDPEVERRLNERLRQALVDFQSPAGYFYERRGPDWNYEIETHHSNHLMAWHYLRDTDLAEAYVNAMTVWYTWLSYNAAIEPDGSGFAMNHAFETRRYFPFYRENRETMYGETCFAMAEEIVLARAFCESREERNARLVRERRVLERSWPRVPRLIVGRFDAYSPYAFLHRSHVSWYPSTAQKAEARGQLPYLALDRFTHRRTDDREQLTMLYVRRPSYYATFTSGDHLSDRQRYGIGLVWRPGMGTVLHSQSGSEEESWGTRGVRNRVVYEADMAAASVGSDRGLLQSQRAVSDVAAQVVSIDYPLGGGGSKEVEFGENSITVTVRHRGEFVETLPLLARSARDVVRTDRGVTMERRGVAMRITHGDDVSSSLEHTDKQIGQKRLSLVRLQARDRLTYTITF